MHERDGHNPSDETQADHALLEIGITTVPELQAHARQHGGQRIEINIFRSLLPEDMHPILERVDHVLVDASGNIGYMPKIDKQD